jgi:hypothetical protein
MSKIKTELVAATGFKTTRGETHDQMGTRLVLAVQDLSDDDWNGLSEEAQDWFNKAAEQVNLKKALPSFPDAEVEATAPAPRRRASADAPAPVEEPAAGYEPKVGDKDVTVINSRDKAFTGEVIEVDDEILVLLIGNDETEFPRNRIKSISGPAAAEAPAPSRRRAAAEDDAPADPAVGDTVQITNMRDKVSMGNIVEMDDEVVVIEDVGGGEIEFQRDRIKSILVKSQNGKKATAPAPAPAPAATSRRGAAKEEKAAPTTKADNGGVAVGTRMREMIINDLSLSRDGLKKALEKEGLVFKENTMDMVYKEVHKIVAMLKEAKLMK